MSSSIFHDEKLSPRAIAILAERGELCQRLVALKELPPLPQDLAPKVMEILFEGEIYIRYERGQKPYFKDCARNFNPQFSEYRLDNITVLFHVDGEIIINRGQNLDLETIKQSLGVN